MSKLLTSAAESAVGDEKDRSIDLSRRLREMTVVSRVRQEFANEPGGSWRWNRRTGTWIRTKSLRQILHQSSHLVHKESLGDQEGVHYLRAISQRMDRAVQVPFPSVRSAQKMPVKQMTAKPMKTAKSWSIFLSATRMTLPEMTLQEVLKVRFKAAHLHCTQ